MISDHIISSRSVTGQRWKSSKGIKTKTNAGSAIWKDRQWSCSRNGWLWECWHCRRLLETLDSKPEELSEGQLINTNEESGCDENDSVRGSAAGKELYSKGTLQAIFMTLKIKNKMLEADPKLESSMTIH